jgi:hypothetical protein
MKILPVLLFFALTCSAASGIAGSVVIIDKPTSDGAIELSNLGTDDEAPAVSPPATEGHNVGAASEPMPNNGDVVSNVNKPSSDTALPLAAAAGGTDNTEAAATRGSQYREKMLNMPLLPNGKPANTAIQRRYLMVKKSDYVPGN